MDEEFRAKLEAALARIPPYRINGRGFLQEWIEDWKPGSQGHNVSPDFPFYPGSSITLRGNPELARAIGNWMETRRPRGGWPTAWDIAMWARLERGDKVAACMRAIVRNSLAPDLHNAGSNQSDCNFGYTAGVAEALLQSHAGEISLLPALPPAGPTARSRACGRAAALKSACSGRPGSWCPRRSAATTGAPARCDTEGRRWHCSSRPVRLCD